MNFKVVAVMLVLMACAAPSFTADEPAVGYKVVKAKKRPNADGDAKEWADIESMEMSKPNVPDLAVKQAKISWSSKYLYMLVTVRDSTLVNPNKGKGIANADCVELRICPKPRGGKGDIFTFWIAPTSYDKKPAMVMAKTGEEAVEIKKSRDKTKIKWGVKTSAKEWTVEVAIPFELINVVAKEDVKIPYTLVVFDRDKDTEDEWVPWHKRCESSNKKAPTNEWPALELKKK